MRRFPTTRCWVFLCLSRQRLGLKCCYIYNKHLILRCLFLFYSILLSLQHPILALEQYCIFFLIMLYFFLCL
eukprot:UN04068